MRSLSHSPPAKRHTTARRRGSIVEEYPNSEADDPVERAKFVDKHIPVFRQGYDEWKARGSDKHTGDSICSEEDFAVAEPYWSEEEFETDIQVTVEGSQRLAKGTGRDSRRRSSSPPRAAIRTRYVSSEQRCPPARPYPWKQYSSSSRPVPADPPARAPSPPHRDAPESSVPAHSPAHRDASPRRSALRKCPQPARAKYYMPARAQPARAKYYTRNRVTFQ